MTTLRELFHKHTQLYKLIFKEFESGAVEDTYKFFDRCDLFDRREKHLKVANSPKNSISSASAEKFRTDRIVKHSGDYWG